jgi:DNA replication protein DnaC
MATVKEVNAAIAGICQSCGFPPGQRGYLRADVAVGHPDFGKLWPCPACNQQAAAQAQPNQLTGWLRQASFSNYGQGADNRAGLEAARGFAARPRHWLTLWGGYGRGKSHLLAAIANACRENGLAALYYTLPDWLDELRRGYEESRPSDLFELSKSVSVLLLDEVDKVYWTGWSLEKVYQLVDARYRLIGEKGTVFALNIDPTGELKEDDYQQIHYLFSRMRDERSKIVKVDGPDARPAARRLWKKGVKG